MPTNNAGSSKRIQFQGPTKRPPLRNDPEHLVSSIRANTTGPNMTTDGDINGSEGNKNVASECNNSAAVAECTDDEDPSFKKEGSYAPQEEQVRKKPAKSKKTQKNNNRDRASTPGPNMTTNGNIHSLEGNKNVSTTFASERNDSATVGECTDDEDPSFDEKGSYAPQEREVPTNTASPKEKPTPAPTLETESGPSGGSAWIGIWTTVIFIIIAFFVCFMLQNKPVEGEPFYKLGTTYPTVDQNLWKMLSVSVRRAITTVDNPEPGTILFLHYGPTDILDGLIDSVIAVTTSHFGNTDAIRLPGAHFKRSDIQQDFGVFVAQQKDALLQRSVMLVRNLEDVPARSARAFHTICDTQEPLVGRAVIYLTLDMAKAAGMHEPSNVSATAEAERLLQKLWGDSLEPAVLGPLITRLTDNVFRIV